MKKIVTVLLIALVLITVTSCSQADIVNRNLSKDADYFRCERRITVYNARTDTIIFEAEGYMSISNDTTSELVVTFMVGPN